MKFELADNAREAFQFLALGVAAVLVIRVVVVLIGMLSYDPDGDVLAEACKPFRNGYPLVDRHAVVVGGLELIPRIAVAGLFTLLCAALIGAVAWLLGRMFNYGGGRSMVVGGRIGLSIGGAWACYCLLCMPAKWTKVNKSELVLHERAAFLGEIPWPFSGSETVLHLSQVDQFLVVNHSIDKHPGIFAYIASDVFTITKPPAGADPDLDVAEQWGLDAARLVATLDALPR